MAASSAACTLSSLASKLGRLERQAELLDDLQAEEQGCLKAHRHPSPSRSAAAAAAGSPSSRCSLLSAQVTELKSYIQAVADAELDGDEDLLALTAAHAARYAVGLIHQATDAGTCLVSKAHQVVVDLAAATLSMLSQRPPAHEVVLTAGAVPVLLQLLDPLQSACAVENAAKMLGNLAADAASRSIIRSTGGIGSLARLLKRDCAPSMQAAAAAALSLLAGRDAVVSDTLRYLGVLPLLVDLLNSPHASVTEAARACLLALKHNNPRNASEILIDLRSNQELCKDYWRLKDALLLLSEAPPAAASHTPLASSLDNLTDCSPAPVRFRRSSAAARPRSPAKAAALHELGVAVEDAQREVAAAAVHVVEALEEEVVRKTVRRAQQPLEALQANLDASIALLKASLAGARASSVTAAGRAAGVRKSWPSSAISTGKTLLGSSCAPDVPKSVAGKHIMRYNNEEVVALLQRMGIDPADTRAVKKAALTGAELLLLSEHQLVALLGVPLHRARRMHRLQEAVALFDSIATRVCQPRLSDIELRLWLAAQGCSSSEAGRVVALLRNLLLSDPDAPMTAWEWAAGFTWVQHAFEVFGILAAGA